MVSHAITPFDFGMYIVEEKVPKYCFDSPKLVLRRDFSVWLHKLIWCCDHCPIRRFLQFRFSYFHTLLLQREILNVAIRRIRIHTKSFIKVFSLSFIYCNILISVHNTYTNPTISVVQFQRFAHIASYIIIIVVV